MNKLDYFKVKVASSFAPVDIMRLTPDDLACYFFLDARTAPTNILTHKVKGAKRIPLSELKSRLKEIPKDKTVVVYG